MVGEDSGIILEIPNSLRKTGFLVSQNLDPPTHKRAQNDGNVYKSVQNPPILNFSRRGGGTQSYEQNDIVDFWAFLHWGGGKRGRGRRRNTVEAQNLADPEKWFQELISEKLLNLLWDRPCLEVIILFQLFSGFALLSGPIIGISLKASASTPKSLKNCWTHPFQN